MFKSENDLQEFVTTQALYRVWIRANETPGAPLVSVWVDSKMRAFEGPGEARGPSLSMPSCRKARPKANRLH
jgi:hypothetical protein